jgi:hypothetical protein
MVEIDDSWAKERLLSAAAQLRSRPQDRLSPEARKALRIAEEMLGSNAETERAASAVDPEQGVLTLLSVVR